jgi:hypothetical protein
MAISRHLVNSGPHINRAVVQLGRTLEWGSRGRGFKSRQPDIRPTNSSQRVDQFRELVSIITFEHRGNADVSSQAFAARNVSRGWYTP